MSEVSSTAMVDEKEQISVPKDLFHDFESLKNVTNLTTVDLMRKLLEEYNFQRDDIVNDMDEMCLSRMTASLNYQRGEMAKTHDQCPQVPDVAKIPRPPFQRSQGRLGRKSGIPGQKLKQVCEILHCKRAAKELAEQRRQENSDRNCNSAGSSSSGTVGCFEEIKFSKYESSRSLHESKISSARKHTQQVPLAHSSSSQDAVNLRKILGNRVNKSAGYETKGCDDSVLDLSVKKYSDTPDIYDYPQNRNSCNVSDTRYNHSPVTVMDTAIFGIQNYTSVESDTRPDNMIPPPIGFTFADPMIRLAGVRESIPHPTTAQGIPPQLSTQYLPVPNPAAAPPAQGTSSMGGSFLEASRMRTRTRKQNTRKPQANEGMKLISENSLYPGVYTSTFKLPGSRRGRRSTAAKQAAAQTAVSRSNAMIGQTATSNQNVVIPAQGQGGSQQSYMMLCPQVAVSSVLVKTPRKRGRPPKRPTITHLQQVSDQQPKSPPMVLPQSQIQICLPGGGAPGLINSDNGTVSYMYKPQTDQSQVTLQHRQSFTGNGAAMAQGHPNHAQLMNILNQATSINACNPIFVPNSSLQSGIPTALPTNASGMITLPCQQLQTEINQMTHSSQTNMQLPIFIKQELSPDNSETPNNALQDTPTEPTIDDDPSTSVKLEGTKDAYQEMILSPQALVSVKPRSKQTTAEMIRSNSNFYCGSFKIRPQKPTTTSGNGVPLKRGRGRPKLHVFESNRQKETTESKSKMYQELYHCKICNEIMSSVDRFSHQRKHIGVKVRCSTCGVEYQGSKIDDLSKDEKVAQCSQCKKIFGNEAPARDDQFVAAEEEEADSPLLDIYEDAIQSDSFENPKDLTSANNVRYPDDACHVCGKVCSTSVELVRHLEQHPDHSFTCTEDGCLRTFRNGSELRRHRKHIHGKGREHACEYDGCDKKFLKNFHLQEHIRVKHFNIKAFKCHWPGCHKEFAGIRHLKVHMLIHNDEKPLKCNFCDYRCRQRNALNWHMRRHTGVPFSGTDGGSSSDSDDQDAQEMVIDMTLQEDNGSMEEMSPIEAERENGEVNLEHESYSDSSLINNSGVVGNDPTEILETE